MYPKLQIYEPEAKKTDVTLLTLHWYTGSIETFAPYMTSPTAFGVPVAVAQSSQQKNKRQFIWNNQEIAVREVIEHIEELNTDIILAGASQGGLTALNTYLHYIKQKEIKGLILFMPVVREETIEQFREIIDKTTIPPIYIFIGDKDQLFPRVDKFANMLRDNNVEIHFEKYPDLGHTVGASHKDDLDNAVKSILKL